MRCDSMPTKESSGCSLEDGMAEEIDRLRSSNDGLVKYAQELERKIDHLHKVIGQMEAERRS